MTTEQSPVERRAWLKRYPPVWDMYTAHMSLKQRGAVWMLMMHYHEHGDIPQDERDLAAAIGISVDEWRPIASGHWGVIETFQRMLPLMFKKSRKRWRA